jgi:hypothetical protein
MKAWTVEIRRKTIFIDKTGARASWIALAMSLSGQVSRSVFAGNDMQGDYYRCCRLAKHTSAGGLRPA